MWSLLVTRYTLRTLERLRSSTTEVKLLRVSWAR